MPSDPRTDLVKRALAEPLGQFQSALATAVEQLRAYLATHRAQDGSAPPSANGHGGLGVFAKGRIDTARFTALLAKHEAVDFGTLMRMERAFAALAEMAVRQDTLAVVDVAPGGDLRGAVGAALERVGRAFGAARVAELSRTGRYDDSQHGALMESLPFVHWTARERTLAPPLVVLVDGADLRAAGLADFLDGSLKIVLVVRGDAPPAPLVRLISPGVFVLQTTDGTGLDRLAAARGPGVAALLPELAARFVHDPAGGPRLADRLFAEFVPEDRPAARTTAQSVWQQNEDLLQFAALVHAATRAPQAAAAAPAQAADVAASAQSEPRNAVTAPAPADQLAAWLLAQADLSGTP